MYNYCILIDEKESSPYKGSMQSSFVVRSATVADAPVLRAIYAPYVTDTAVTYEYEVPSLKEFERRIGQVLSAWPYLVLEADGRIVGYAYASKFHAREAYKKSVETSIYLSMDARGKGYGSLLEKALASECLRRGQTAMYACISATEREHDPYLTDASIRFHEKRGYRLCGRFSRCAVKFGLDYDMVYMEKHLD